MPWISPEAREAILAVPHFAGSHYTRWNLEAVLASYISGHVDPLMRLAGSGPITVADVGTGYGWLAIAFALRTDARIIAMDFDHARVVAARKIAAIMGVEHRIEWLVGSVGQLPLVDNAVDAALCLEVIEHVSRDPAIIHDLNRITRDILVVSTPNGALPIVFHDTALPFCHWLPPRARDRYAAAFGRKHLQDGNRFWRPAQLAAAMAGFDRVSAFFHHRSYADYAAAQTAGHVTPRAALRQKLQAVAYGTAARLGGRSFYCLPNLASTWRRRA